MSIPDFDCCIRACRNKIFAPAAKLNIIYPIWKRGLQWNCQVKGKLSSQGCSWIVKLEKCKKEHYNFSGVNISTENQNCSPSDQKLFPSPNMKKILTISFHKEYKGSPKLINHGIFLNNLWHLLMGYFNFTIFPLIPISKKRKKTFFNWPIFSNCS